MSQSFCKLAGVRLHRCLLFVFLTALLPSLASAQPIFLPSIFGSANSVSVNTSQFANEGYENLFVGTIDGINVSASVTFSRGVLPIASPTAEFRVGFRLLNSQGNPVFLQTFGTIVYDDDWEGNFDAGFPINLPSGVSSVTYDDFEAKIQPVGQLDPNETYTVEVIVYWFNSSDPLDPWKEASTEESSGSTFLHFVGNTSGDPEVNVLSILNSVSFTDRSALATGNGGESETGFEVTANTTLHRFDNWDSPRAQNLVSVLYDVELWRLDEINGDEQIPLQQTRFNILEFVYNHNEDFFGSEFPYQETVDHSFHIVPDGVQLDPVNEVYYARVQVSHVEELTGPTEKASNTVDSLDAQLLHFNGDLIFNTIKTVLNTFSNDPSPGAIQFDTYLQCSLTGAAGVLAGNPLYTFAPSNFTVRLEADGTAVVISPSATPSLNQPLLPDRDTVGNVRFDRDTLVLDHTTTTGLTGNLTVFLPTGMAYSPTRNSHRYIGTIPIGTQDLTQELLPNSNTFSYTPPGTIHVVEESKPVAYAASEITWFVDTSTFETKGIGDVAYLRDDELTTLEAGPLTAAQKIKRSNEQYYRRAGTLQNSNTVVTTVGSQQDARMQAEFDLGPNSFIGHFPYGIEVAFNSGFVSMAEDLFIPSKSTLDGITVLVLNYNQACLETSCGNGTFMQNMAMFPVDGELQLTPDGGLVAEGTIDTSTTPDYLAWGYINSVADFHHVTSKLSGCSFHMSGHFVRGDNNTHINSNLGPATILHTGVLASDPNVIERPMTSEYQLGLADYAGFNYRTLADSAVQSDSRIAGNDVTFDLTGRCKYYIRPAGVTGIHEAVPGSFPSSLFIYEYDFTFTQYGLSYIVNNPYESRTEGSIVLPYPSDFIQDFEELLFTCLGGLDSAKVPDGGGDQTMAYWLANIIIHTINFESADACVPESPAKFLAGVSAEAAYVDAPLYGILGFEPNGTLITGPAFPATVNSRLHLPAVIRFDGPTKGVDPGDPSATETEVYQLVPATLAYYNDYDSTSEQAQGDGRLNFAGSLDVAFFEDLKVHVQTSARNVLPTQTVPIRLMGGWSSGSDTFFNSPDFDPGNVGFPSGVSEAVYRNDPNNGGNPVPWLIEAQQQWLGVVNFNYKLQWSSTTRSFKSYEPDIDDLLVVRAEHKLNYLSAEKADLSVGITYEGMPQVSLTSFVINEIAESTGVYQAILTEAKKPVVDTIEGGIERMAELLDDQMQVLYDDFLSQTVETEVVDPLYVQLRASAISSTYSPAVISALLNDRLRTGSDNLRSLLTNIGSGLGQANYLFTEIDERLADIEYGIDAVINGIEVDSNGKPISSPQPGSTSFTAFLAKNANDDFQILTPLVERLLAEIAPGISAELSALLSGAVDDLNSRINELFEDAKPSIDQIVVVLTDLRTTIGAVRTAIAPAGDFLEEIQTIVSSEAAPGEEIDLLTAKIRDELSAYFATLPTDADFLSYTEAEIKQRIRQEIRDRFFGAVFVAEIQVTLKQHLYDVDAAINEAISTCFAQVNTVIRDLVSEALASVDDSLTGFLGDITAVLGGGKLNGHAQFNGDALRRLHIDLFLQLKIPDNIEFNGYLTIDQLDSEGDDSCSPGAPGGVVTEVRVGALDVPADWISPDLRISVEARFNFQSSPSVYLLGLGGSFELTSGEISFEAFRITDMGAALMFGASENYIAAKLGLAFNSYEAFGGVYFGRTCDIAPLKLVDKDVAEVIGEPTPTFTGIYMYGECHIPISEAVLGIPATCFFRISAGVGAGAFYFVEGNTLGGKIYAAVSGEALCIVSIKGEVTMIGVLREGDLSFRGKGRLSGKVGPCPFCVKFGKTATITYRSGSWDVDI